MLLNAAFGGILGAQGFQWAKRAGLWAYDYGYGITTDNSGNVYIAGKYEMKANFSGTVVPCQGNHDIYVAKYTPSGALAWVRTAGGYTGDYATCIATDGSYVYIAGEIEGAGAKITFVGSPITLYAQGSNDVFIAKYDLNGNLIWARRAGSYDWDKATGIACDNAGNVYICGYFKNKAVFGGTSTIYSSGAEDIFVAKYNSSGTFLWVRKAGGPERDEAKEIGVDGSGNVYVCGMFKKTANFSGTNVTSSGHLDMFLAKYSSSGNLQWVKKAGGAWDDAAWSLTIDNAGKIFVAGEFNSSAYFGGIKLTTAGAGDIFVARFNSSGNAEWAKRAGGKSLDRARGIGTDGNIIYVTGQFGSSATFGNTTKYAADHWDIFISSLSNNGDFLWTTTVGGPADKEENLGYESGNAICAEPNGNVYATGALLSGGTFGGTKLNAYSRTDIFLAKLKNGSGGGGDPMEGTDLIAANSSWKYLDNGSNQGTSWRTASYSDSWWKTGNAQLGYGDGDEATVVSYGPSSSNKYITTYFRKIFNVVNASTVSGLELSLIRDDGAVIYINGSEVYRNNMPSGTISYNTLASGSATSTESVYQVSNIGKSALVNGTNLIAVEMHQHSAGSSDLSFNLKLRAVSGGKMDDMPEENSTELISFNGEEKGNKVYLSWITAREENNDYFIIERSIDKENFEEAGIVMGAGNSDMELSYLFIDSLYSALLNEEGGLLYYRLNMTDYDGVASYSPAVEVKVEPLSNLSVGGRPVRLNLYPNPVKHSFTLSFSETPEQQITLSIYDINGKLISETTITNDQSQIDVSSFVPGVYLVGIKAEDEIIFSEKIIIQE